MDTISPTPSTSGSGGAADQLANIGAEKLTAAVLVAERADNLIVREIGQLSKTKTLFEEVLQYKKDLPIPLAVDIIAQKNHIAEDLELIERERLDSKTRLGETFPLMAQRIYTHSSDYDICPPAELVFWSRRTNPAHARLIDDQDQYSGDTQIPVAYPAAWTPSQLEEWYENFDADWKEKEAMGLSPLEYARYNASRGSPRPSQRLHEARVSTEPTTLTPPTTPGQGEWTTRSKREGSPLIPTKLKRENAEAGGGGSDHDGGLE